MTDNSYCYCGVVTAPYVMACRNGCHGMILAGSQFHAANNIYRCGMLMVPYEQSYNKDDMVHICCWLLICFYDGTMYAGG